jgi:predicted alpha/beta hydrolase
MGTVAKSSFCRRSSPSASVKARHNLFSRFGEGAQPRGDQRPRRPLAMILLWGIAGPRLRIARRLLFGIGRRAGIVLAEPGIDER